MGGATKKTRKRVSVFEMSNNVSNNEKRPVDLMVEEIENIFKEIANTKTFKGKTADKLTPELIEGVVNELLESVLVQNAIEQHNTEQLCSLLCVFGHEIASYYRSDVNDARDRRYTFLGMYVFLNVLVEAKINAALRCPGNE